MSEDSLDCWYERYVVCSLRVKLFSANFITDSRMDQLHSQPCCSYSKATIKPHLQIHTLFISFVSFHMVMSLHKAIGNVGIDK